MKKNKKENTESYIEKYESAVEKGRKIKSYYTKAYARANQRIEELVENMAFYEGTQYNLDSYQTNKPWVVQMNTPYATLAIDTRVASLIATDYIGELEPYSADDKEIVDGLMALYQDMWEELAMNKKISKAIASAAVVREAYIHVIADTEKISGGTNRKNKGKMKAYFIDPTHVWIDPNARKFSDARYVCITERIDKKVAYQKYPFLKDNLTSSSFAPQERGEVYISNDYTTEQEDALTKITVYVKEISDKKPVIKKYTLIEDALVDEKSLTSLKSIPIAQFRWKDASDSPYGISLMDELLSLQKAINAIESGITNTALAYASPSMMVNTSCGVDPKVLALALGSPGSVFAVDGSLDNAIKPVTPPQINERIVSIKVEYENAISTIAGINSGFNGILGTAGNTSSGTEMAINRSTIIENIVIRNIEDFVEQLTNIITDYIISLYAGQDHVYTRTRDVSGNLTFNDRQLDEGIRDVAYSFYVDLSKRTQFSKEKEKQDLKDLYQMERQYDAEIKLINEIDILEETDLRNKDVLKQRYQRMNSQNNQQKIQLINSLSELVAKYNINQELVQQAQIEIMTGDDKMEAYKQVIQMAEQMRTRMEQAMTQSNEQLISMGVPQQAVQQATQQMQEQGVTASMLGLQ